MDIVLKISHYFFSFILVQIRKVSSHIGFTSTTICMENKHCSFIKKIDIDCTLVAIGWRPIKNEIHLVPTAFGCNEILLSFR